MPLPANVSTGTVTGKLTKSDGNPSIGIASFHPNVRSLYDAALNIVLAGWFQRVVLNGSGAFSIVLAATNDVDLTPAGWLWIVHIELDDQPNIDFSMAVPASTSTDIADVMTP